MDSATTTMSAAAAAAPLQPNASTACERVGCLDALEAIPTIASMLIVMLIIVLGNALVVITVYRDTKLRSQRQNWLIVSLACADLLVGLIVMPITLAYEIANEWILGPIICEMWLALDVLFVTASILHICAISLDRYFCVTQPLSYPSKRTPVRMMLMIGVSWMISLLVSLPPVLMQAERKQGECLLSDNKAYVFYSAFGSFYIPVIILVAVYAKIYSITIQHNRNRMKETERLDKTLKLGLNPKSGMMSQAVEVELVEYNSDGNEYDETTTAMSTTKKTSKGIGHVCWHVRKMSDATPPKQNSDDTPTTVPKFSTATGDMSQRADQALVNGQAAEKRKRKLKAKERQATLLLGLILFGFIISWLPFFLMYVLSAFGIETPEFIFKFFFWLGYCNSGVNPVIYTVFNREFKRALCRQLRKMWRSLEPIFNKSAY